MTLLGLSYLANDALAVNGHLIVTGVRTGVGAAMAAGDAVNVTLERTLGTMRDGTIDNLIVAHEWGHVLSNRLVHDSSGLLTVQAGGATESAFYRVQVADTPGAPNAGVLAADAPAPETLSGLAGQSDVFAWTLADAGTEAAPRTWQVQDFDTAPISAGGDVLDLRDLLVGANSQNVGAFLDFSQIGGDTVLTVNNDGQGAANLSITLQGVDLAAAQKLADKVKSGDGFDLNDFLAQLSQMKKMGGLSGLLDKLPSELAAKAGQADMGKAEKDVRRMEGIINSMTPLERRRKKRIAAGAGVQVQEVNRLLNQFEQMRDMMKKMRGGGLMKMMKRMGGMKGMPGL